MNFPSRFAQLALMSLWTLPALAQTGSTGPQQVLTHAQATKHVVADLESAESIAARLSEIVRRKSGSFSFVINFDYDQSNIRPEFSPLLNTIGSALAEEPAFSFVLGIDGHTDWDGSDAYNTALSKRRALAVEDYFAEHFSIRFAETRRNFWGESKPTEPNTTRNGMARNRRAEFSIRAAEAVAGTPFDRFAVAFSPDGRYGLTGANNTLALRNTQLDCHQRSLSGHTGKILAATFSPNGRLAISGAEDRTVKVWDVATGREIRTYYGHRGPVNTIAITDDGLRAASGSEDRTLKLWSLVNDRELTSLQGHRSGVTAVDLSPNGWYAASGDRTGAIILWHVGNKTELRRIQAATAGVSSIVFFENDRFLSAAIDGSVKIWDASNGRLLRTMSHGGEAILTADISDDARFAVTAGTGGQVRVWNMATAELHRNLEGHGSDVVFAGFSRNGDLLLTADDKLSHRVWDFDSGRAVRDFIPLHSVRPDDGLLAGQGKGPGDVWTEPKSSIDLIRLSGGCYSMGCGTWSENCSKDELPVHEACIDELWIGRHEVTQAQWQRVMQTNPSRFKRGGGHPVEQVSWDQAQEFVCRLNQLSGMEFRLPTEAEWEYACRSGGREITYSTADFQPASTERSSDETQFSDNTFANEVDSWPANQVGLIGMGEGVWEWIADVYEDNLNVSVYSEHSRNNPLYTGSNDYRFSSAIYPRGNRGGSWDINRNPSRCSLRHFDDPGLKSFFHGFRVAVSGSPPNGGEKQTGQR